MNLDKGKYETNIACVVLGADTDQQTTYSHLTVGQDVQLDIDYYYAVLVDKTSTNAYGVVVDFVAQATNGALISMVMFKQKRVMCLSSMLAAKLKLL